MLGDTHAAFDLDAKEIVIFGSDGLLVAGKNSRRHDKALLAFLSLQSRDQGVLGAGTVEEQLQNLVQNVNVSTSIHVMPKIIVMITRPHRFNTSHNRV